MKVKSAHPLRAICKRDNLTIEKLAEATGLGTTTVWRAFNGKPINAHSRQQLCDYFGMTSEELGLVSVKTDEVANQAPPFSNSHAPVGERNRIEEAQHEKTLTNVLSRYLQQQRMNMLVDLVPGSTHLRMGDIVGSNGLFIAPPWEMFHGATQSANLIDYLIDALSRGQRVLLLGEAGQGKTTILKQVFTMMVDRFLASPEKILPVPLYVPLREFTYTTDDAIELFWMHVRHEFPLPFEHFALLVRNNYFVFLFDGFDEIKGDLTQRSINERASSRVFSYSAILSCRKNFYDFYLSTSLIQERYSHKIELRPLKLTDPVTQYIAAFCHKKQESVSSKIIVAPETIVETIRTSQQLRDLAQRPVLLTMILDIFTDPQEIGEREWDIAKLYGKYTEKWLKNEATKPDSVLKWNEKTAIVQEIAWSIYVTRTSATSTNENYQSGTFTQYDVSRVLERFTHRYPRTSLGQLIDDICLHTFPIVKDGDSYRFFEKSFQDYYVAQYIFELMRSKEHLVAPVALALQEFLSVEVVTFLKDMFSAKDFSRHDRALVVDILIKAYQQNIADDHHAATIRQNACSYLTFLGTQKAIQFLERIYEQEPNKWVQRGIMVGLALFCDREDILERYIDIVHNDSEAASINIGYHLAYYGDQALEEGYYDRGGNRCDGTVRAIFRHLRSECYRSGWAIDLFTLRMLLEQRGTVVLSANQQHLPFLGEFLNRDHRGQGRAFLVEKLLLQDVLKGAALL